MNEAKTPAVPLWVRVPRYSIPVLFAAGALPAFFVFPFLFDSPQMNEPVAVALTFAAFFSPIVGFLLAEWPYRRAAKAQKWRQAFGWTLVPVLLPACLWPTLNGYLSWARHQAYEQRFVLRTAENVPVARLEMGPSCQDAVGYSHSGEGVSARGSWSPLVGAGTFQCEKRTRGDAKAHIWINADTTKSLRNDRDYRNLDTAPPRLESIKGGQVTVSSYQVSAKHPPHEGRVYSQVTGYVFRTEAGQLLGEAGVSRPLNSKGAVVLSLAVVRAPGIRALIATDISADEVNLLTTDAIHEHVKALDGYLQNVVRDPR